MKNIYFIIPVLLLALNGCSSIYNMKQSNSKETFYDNFNKSVKDKKIKIILTNDSSFAVYGGSIIANDSLCYLSQVKEEIKIEPGRIKNIKYFGNDMSSLSAIITLKDVREVTAKNVSLNPDSSIKTIITKNIKQSIPLSKIKEVSYKNRWLGIPPRFVIGTSAGFMLGLIIGGAANDNTQGGLVRSELLFIAGPAIGALIGIMWGYMDGYNYIYQFNR